MSKIVLNDITNVNQVSVLNDNFDKIEREFQEKVLYRDNPSGEPNTMKNSLDMNSHRILNLPEPINDNEAARLKDIQESVEGITASEIVFIPTPGVSSEDVQDAIEEVENQINSLTAGDVGADPVGSAINAISVHESKIDPHPQYLTEQEADALYEPLGSGLVNPMEAAGDMIIGGASGAPQKLSAGSNGSILTMDSGVPSWETPSYPTSRNVVTNVSSSSGVLTIDASLGDYFTVSLTENIANIVINNSPPGASLMIQFTQDSSPRTITWPSSFKWIDNTPKTISAVASSVNLLAISTFSAGVAWLATLGKDFE